MLVRDCMTVNPPTVEASTLGGEVLERMRTTKIRCLLVLEKGRLVGIVTRTDVMRALFPPGALPTGDGVPVFMRRLVGEVMTKDPIVVQSHVPVEQAARVLNERNIQSLPVVDGPDLVGLVTSRDLAGSLAHLLGGDIKGIRMTVDLPNDLHNLRQLVDAMTPLKPALFPLVLAVRLDNLEHRALLRVATPRPLLVAETLAMEGFRLARMQFDPPGRR